MSIARASVLLASLASALAFAQLPASADGTADLRSFITLTKPLTFAGIVGLRGKLLPKETDEWTSPMRYGPSLRRCLVVDLPSLTAIISGGHDVASSAIQCDGARRPVAQSALVAWAVATISPLLPGYTMKRNPARRPGDRSSVVWKNARGVTFDFIAMGPKDPAGYNVSIEIPNPSTPSPEPTDETP